MPAPNAMMRITPLIPPQQTEKHPRNHRQKSPHLQSDKDNHPVIAVAQAMTLARTIPPHRHPHPKTARRCLLTSATASAKSA
jgi:hypothetical protein